MKNKYILPIIVLFSIILIGMVYASWRITQSVENSFLGYNVISLEDTSDSSINAFTYNSSGFVGDNQYNTSFNITLDLKKKEEIGSYNIIVSLIDQDSFLDGTTISSTYEYGGETINGNDIIYINNITSDRQITISFSLAINDSNFSPIYNALDNNKELYIIINASTSNGNWSITKNINLIATKQSYISLSIPTMTQDSYEYTGLPQSCIAENDGYTISNNTRTNAGTQTVTVSLNDGYQWEGGDLEDKTYTFTIEKADLSVTANSVNITYGDSPTNDNCIYNGFVNNETSSVLSGTLTYSYNYSQYDDVGNYAITPSGLTSNNYNITFNNGTLTVSAKQIGITWTNTSFTYDKTSHIPTATATGTVNNDSVTITVASAQINAGTYTATATALSNSNYKLPSIKTKQFTIAKKEITYTAADLSFDSSYRTWSQIQGQISLTASGIISGDTVTATVDGMHNGHFYFGTTDSTYNGETLVTETNVVGSTYLLNIVLSGSSASNYSIDNNKTIFKYQTSLIGSSYDINTTFYTIEDVITSSASGTIYFPGDSTNETSYIYTSFCALSGNDYPYASTTYNLTKNLIVPYEAAFTENGYNKNNGELKGNIFSALYVSQNITLNLGSSNMIQICAMLWYKQPDTSVTGARGVIYNDGTININGTLYSYGYLKGNGRLNCNTNSSIYDVLRTYDWPGGQTAYACYVRQKTMPLNAWSFHNISCETKIKYGCQYYGEYLGYNADIDKTALIISNSTSSNAVFVIKDSNSYIIKKVTPALVWNESNTNYSALTNLNGSNQIKGQKDIVELYGNFTTAQFALEVYSGVNLKTSTSTALPIGYMDVILKGKNETNQTISSTFILNNTDLLFLPGTKLVIEENASFTSNSSCDLIFEKYSHIETYSGTDSGSFYNHCIDTNDAKLIINGSFNSKGNIAGIIKSEKVGATLTTTGFGAQTFIVLKAAIGGTGSAERMYKVTDMYSQGYIGDTNSYKNFLNNNTYTYQGEYWSGTAGTITNLDGAQTGLSANGLSVPCVSPDTLIMLNDGTQKMIKDLLMDDLIIVFNHETGEFTTSKPLAIFNHGYEECDTLKLYFNDNSILKIVKRHALFDLDLNKYVDINPYNYSDFIGHRFVKYDYSTNSISEVILVSVDLNKEYIEAWGTWGYQNLSCITNGILSIPSAEGTYNYFEYDENLKYNEELMQKDIEKYGLYTYDDWKDIIPYYVFDAYNFKYFKIAIGKGLATYETYLDHIQLFYNLSNKDE